MKRISFLTVLLLGFIGSNFSQNVFNPNDPAVRYWSGATYGTAQNPDTNLVGLQKFVSTATNGISTGTGSWDASSYKAYFINYYNTRLAFRVKFPRSYTNPDSASKKYPMMLFMHGAGEVGCSSNNGIYNNEKQLALGGQLFMNAVDNNQFDGFLIYPQLNSTDGGCWGEWGNSPSAKYNTVITFIDSVIKYARADIDRLFIDGLSGGGVGTWRLMEQFPTRVAAIGPTSAAGLQMNYSVFVHIPIWLATGGKDTNPSPAMAQYSETQVTSIGGYIRRTLYPTLGHASWYAHWGEPDFIPFMNSAHKANPLIFFNRFEFCPDSAISTKIGVSPGFYAYEWQKDGVTIATRTNSSNTIIDNSSIISFTGNEVTVKAFGTYRVRFKRTASADWSVWSPKPAVISPKSVTQTPPITTVGLRSNVLPSLDGKTSVQLQMPAGFLNYQWVRTTDNALVSTNQIYDAAVGTYKARYSEPYGCGTLYSPVFKVTAASGTPKPDPAKNLAVSSLSQTGLRLDWSDNPNAGTNETGFEIYRGVKAGGPYTLVAITAQNAITFNDTTLNPNSKYFYVIRSVAATGAAANSNEASGTTQVDNVAPTAPVNLEYRGSNSGTVFLRWGAATDDVGLARYDIYVNGTKTYSTTNLSFPVANLDSLTSYTFVVKAVDKAGNVSPSSNQVLGFTHRQGLTYKYYQGTFNTLPDFNALTPVKTGITDTVNAGDGIRTQDDNYGFLWEGRIYIPISGNYTFETNSDDGSKMYLDVPYGYTTTAFINNDGAHGATTVTATKYLAQGYHTVAYTFAEIGGDQVMDIYWSSTGTGLARERVPKNFLALSDNSSAVTILSAPSSLVATPVSYNKINLRWKDNSTDETGFEIVRATSATGTFAPVGTVSANTTSYNDSALAAGTTYYYKVRAINATGSSPFEYSFSEANWDFNNSYADSTGVAANALNGTNTSFSSSDKVEGTHAVSIANSGYLTFNTGSGGFPSAGGYNQRSVSLWIKPSSIPIIGKRMIFDFGGSDNGLGLRTNNSDLVAGIASGSSRTSITLSNFANDPNWKMSQWNHVALVYDVNSLTLYLNGTSVASTNTLTFSSVGNSTNASRIGNYSGSNVFNDGSYSTWVGLIDNMYVVRGALAKSEVDSIRSFVYMPSSTTTLPAPPKPVAPSALTAQAISGDTIQLSWTDNSDNETSFQIFRSSGNKSNNRLIATVPPANGGQVNFLDTALFANVTYYYRVRATGVTAPSDSSSEVSATTLNTKPSIKKIRDFTMKYGTTFVLPVNATDTDGDVLTFSVGNLPTFGTLASVSNGNSTISFSPSIAKRGSYKMSVLVSDGNGGKDSTVFTLTVNSNDIPVLSPGKDTTINEGSTLSIPFTATDNNGTSAMVWSFDGLPSFGTFVNNNDGTGSLNFNPGYAASGTYQITVTLNDGYGAWTSAVVNLTVLDKEPNETVQFDFRSTSAPVATWNNVNVVSPSFSHAAVYDVKGNLSSMALSLISGSVSPTTVGWTTGANTGVYPDAVLKDGMIWSFNTGTNATDTIQVKVSGLDATKNYNFIFQSSYNINATTVFKIGTASVARNAYQNTLNADTLKSIVPNSAGEVVITMIGDVSTSRGGVLNAMVIRANYDDGSAPAKPTNLAGVHVPNSGVNLTWQDRAYNESAYYVYRANVKTGPYTLLNNGANNKDSVSYSDKTVSPATVYFYYVQGINGAGMGMSSDTIKVTTGNNAPVITSAAGVYVKAGATITSDFSATDDPGDVVTVSISNQPSFVSLQNLGGANYRLTVNPGTDNIGVYSLMLKATDNQGAVATKIISVGVSDKNTRSVFIHFGNTAAALPWNNWPGTKASGAVLTALKDETNTTTPFAVTNSVLWSGTNDLGHLTGNNSGVYPDSVLASGIMDVSGPKSFTFSGLNNAMKYNVVFVGSMNEGSNNIVEYSSGSIKDTLNSKYNTNQTGNVNGLVPVNGSISVTATRVGSSSVNYLNAMVLEEYDPTLVTILNPLNLYAEPVDRNNVDLSWSDRTADEDVFAGYVLDRATDSLFIQNMVSINLPANTSTYRYSGLNANTKYWFRVRAKSGGGAFSDYSNRVRAITPASIVYVHFNYTMPNAAAPWNNTYSAPSVQGSTFSNLTNQSGVVSGLSLTLTRIFNGEFTAGATTGNNSGVVPDAVLASDYWLDNTQISEFKVTGLNQSRRYRIGFIGSSGPNGWFKGNYTATYTVNGRTVYLNSWLNNSKIVYIGDIVPSDDGSVLLDFSTTTAAQYGFNAGLLIQDYTDPSGSGSQSNLVLSNPSVLADVMGQNPVTNAQIAANASSVKTRIYPNPFVDFINMDFNNSSASNNVSVDVYDLSGKLSYHRNYGKLPAGNNTLSVNGNEAAMITGVYIVTLNINGKPVQASKVMRTKK